MVFPRRRKKKYINRNIGSLSLQLQSLVRGGKENKMEIQPMKKLGGKQGSHETQKTESSRNLPQSNNLEYAVPEDPQERDPPDSIWHRPQALHSIPSPRLPLSVCGHLDRLCML